MSTNPQELALQYGQAWANHDPDAIAALHTEDSVFHMHNITAPACGRAAVRDAIAGAYAGGGASTGGNRSFTRFSVPEKVNNGRSPNFRSRVPSWPS